MVAFTTLLALLPLLPLGLAQPAHQPIRRVNTAQHHRLAERADIGQRLVRRAVDNKGAKRGTCRVRGQAAPSASSAAAVAESSAAPAPAESSAAASVIGNDNWAKPVSLNDPTKWCSADDHRLLPLPLPLPSGSLPRLPLPGLSLQPLPPLPPPAATSAVSSRSPTSE